MSVPPLHTNAIHVWHADLDDAGHDLRRCLALLSADEIARAERLSDVVLRRRFIVRRGLLRGVLSRYLGCAPDRIRYVVSEQGKPALDPGFSAESLCFNLSDCGGRALIAVTRIGAVGVDLEAVTPIAEMNLIVPRWFSAAEQAELAQLHGKDRVRGFYLAWTRKEALIKAEGTGLSRDLASFSVTLTPGRPARLVHAASPALRLFRVLSVDMPAPYVAACAVVAPQGSPPPDLIDQGLCGGL